VSTKVELPTVNDMAAILGVTAESVRRILAEFKRQRILQPMDYSPREGDRIVFPRLRQQTC
jgi:DNA-binding transcriptional regulator YhcF (GntR family)